jgi:hypothetical protein
MLQNKSVPNSTLAIEQVSRFTGRGLLGHVATKQDFSVLVGFDISPAGQ